MIELPVRERPQPLAEVVADKAEPVAGRRGQRLTELGVSVLVRGGHVAADDFPDLAIGPFPDGFRDRPAAAAEVEPALAGGGVGQFNGVGQ